MEESRRSLWLYLVMEVGRVEVEVGMVEVVMGSRRWHPALPTARHPLYILAARALQVTWNIHPTITQPMQGALTIPDPGHPFRGGGK